MKLERKKNSVRNIKAGMMNKLITILIPFIMRTILIKVLGSEYLGLSSLFTALLQVLSLSELGIGSAMVFELYEPIAKNDKKRICELQKLYKIVYKIIGTVILTLGIILLPFIENFIKGGYPADINLYALYVLYLLNSSVSYVLFAYKTTLLSAYQRRDILLNVGTIVHILLYSVQIICLINFKNYYAYVIWLPIFTIIENILNAIYVNKEYPEYRPVGKLEKTEIKNIFIKVRDLFGHKLSSVVTVSIDTIIISTFLGLNMVTIYNNYYYLLSAISGVLDIIYQGVLAGIGNSIASETKQKNKNDFNKFSFINSWIVGWCSICFLCLYQPMIKIWLGDAFLLPFSSVILLCIYFYVWKIRQSVLVYKDAAGMWNIDKIKPYVEIIINLILNIILVQFIGINGIILATIISMLCISLPWENKKFFKEYFNESTVEYYKKMLLYLIVTILGAFITYSICNLIIVQGVSGFIMKILICVFVPNIILCIMCIIEKNKNFISVLQMLKLNKDKE